MAVVAKVRHWVEARHDKAFAFIRFSARRFIEDRLLDAAATLAYATLFAAVPLAAVVFGVASMFPFYENWVSELTRFIFDNFMPSAAESVSGYLAEAAGNARALSGVGAITVLVTALLTLSRIEDTFNRIWRVSSSRRPLSRLLIYWAALTLLPLLAIASFAVSSYLATLPLLGSQEATGGVLAVLPVVLQFVAFTLAYRLIPNRTVSLKHAVMAGVLATVLFELAKWGFALYLSRANYQALYGAIAVIPIFLIWLYVSWVVVLLGASYAAALTAFRYRPSQSRLPKGYEFYGLLRVLGRFSQAYRSGSSLHSSQLQQLEPTISDDTLMACLRVLSKTKVIQRIEDGAYVLARDLSGVSLMELYEESGFRLPLQKAPLPDADDRLGQQILAGLELVRGPICNRMRRSINDILSSNEFGEFS